MPTLIKGKEGQWNCNPDTEEVDWTNVDTFDAGKPLMLKCDDEPDAGMTAASLIGVEFPAFNDGRALSLAVLLRTRFGFSGDLRAIGEVHEDILHYMVRCGFTSFQLSPDRNPETALGVLTPYSGCYQGSVVDPDPAFRRLSRGSVNS